MRDLVTWERHQLPLASPEAYPVAIRLDVRREALRPDAGRLAYFEGLLRALALSSEDEMDSGRWSREVATADGPVVYELTLPDILEAEASPDAARAPTRRVTREIARRLAETGPDTLFMDKRIDDIPSTAVIPLEQAEDLADIAGKLRGRRQLIVIRKALALSPDCADAYLLLAQRASSHDERVSFLEQGVAAAARVLGPAALDPATGTFPGHRAARLYSELRGALATCLGDGGMLEEAAGHLQSLLDLDPEDSVGARYTLLPLLLELRRDADAEALLASYDSTASALWVYAAVLLALRAKDRRLARSCLRTAVRTNRHVPRYLTGERELPEQLPNGFTTGDHDEAVMCAYELMDAWTDPPGAQAWLRAETGGRK